LKEYGYEAVARGNINAVVAVLIEKYRKQIILVQEQCGYRHLPYLVPERKLLIFPISASGLNFGTQ